MSDDLVRCFSTYSVMMAEDEDVKWVKHKDYKAAADRIEELEAERDKAWKTCLAATTRGMELEAKLSIAVEALEYIKDTLSLYSAKEALDKIKGEQP